MLKPLGWCVVLSTASFGALWFARLIYYAVGVYLLDVGMHRQLERILWISGVGLLLCAAASLWSGRSVWRRMVGEAESRTIADDPARAHNRRVFAAAIVLTACLASAVVLYQVAHRMAQPP